MNNSRYAKALPWLAILIGLIYLSYLATSIHPDTFFSGDAGLKFLITKQINEGKSITRLESPHASWVQDIWREGFFPFKKPFVYALPEGYVFSFPPAFQWISSFLFGKFGYIGLYIIPFISTVLLWCWMIALLSFLRVDKRKQAWIIFAMILASPLSLYALTYWEHASATLLMFSGAVFICRSDIKSRTAFLLGLLSGLAFWLRPEAIMMSFLYCLVVILYHFKDRKAPSLLFILGSGFGVLSFLVFNYAVFGTLFGVHGMQVLEEYTFLYKLLRGVKYGALINWTLITHCLILLLLLPIIWLALVKHKPVSRHVKSLLVVILVYCALTSFMFPNTGGAQWGPRYFLGVLPLAFIILASVWQEWETQFAPYRRPLYIVSLSLLLYSTCFNIYNGGIIHFREENYNRVQPALDFVRTIDEKTIVVNTQFIPMEMSDVFNERNFFLAEDSVAFKKIVRALQAKQVRSILYISDVIDAPGLPNLLNNKRVELIKKGNYWIGEYRIMADQSLNGL